MNAPKTISILNKKGGCTKSSVSVNLAAALANAGLQVVLVDSDSNRHSLKWFERAGLNPDYEATFKVVGLAALTRSLAGAEVVLIDTAAQISDDEIADYAASSDLAIVPIVPTIDCYGPTLETVEVLGKASAPYRLLLSSCPSRSPEAEMFRETLEGDGHGFFAANIRQSVGVPRSSLQGTTVEKMPKSLGGAGEDFAGLAAEVIEILEAG